MSRPEWGGHWRDEAEPREGSQPLDPEEVWRLTMFKWRYSLQAMGFNEREVRFLLFHKWLVSRAGAHD